MSLNNGQNFKETSKNGTNKISRLWVAYLLMAGLALGVRTVVENKYANHKENTEQNDLNRAEKTGFDAFKERLEPITPWLIVDLIIKEGVVLDENGLHKPYQDSRGIWTIGYGSTCLKDGTPVTKNTPRMTNEEAYELARWHIEDYETFPMLYWYHVYDNKLDFKNANEAIGMGSIFYNAANNLIENKTDSNNRNRFSLLRQYRDGETGVPCMGYGANIPEALIKECFERYPINETFSFGKAWLEHDSPQQIAKTLVNFCVGGSGLYWRRWMEAGLITGKIDPMDLLICPVNGMPDFIKFMGGFKNNKSKKKK